MQAAAYSVQAAHWNIGEKERQVQHVKQQSNDHRPTDTGQQGQVERLSGGTSGSFGHKETHKQSDNKRVKQWWTKKTYTVTWQTIGSVTLVKFAKYPPLRTKALCAGQDLLTLSKIVLRGLFWFAQSNQEGVLKVMTRLRVTRLYFRRGFGFAQCFLFLGHSSTFFLFCPPKVWPNTDPFSEIILLDFEEERHTLELLTLKYFK